MSIFLFVLYSILISSVILMLLCINPIHSVLFFILLFLSASFILIILHAYFIGLIFLMVYVGAISVLFLFVVMMLNIKRIERDNATYLVIGVTISLFFFLQIFYLLLSSYSIYIPFNLLYNNSYTFSFFAEDMFDQTHNVILIGISLFNTYPLLLIFSGITLLVAMIGAIYLTHSKAGYSSRRFDNQLLRNTNINNLHIY